MKQTRKEYRQLTGCIIATLLFSGGQLYDPAIGKAQETTIQADYETDAEHDTYGNHYASDPYNSDDTNTTDNTITMTGGTVRNIYGAQSDAPGYKTSDSVSFTVVDGVLRECHTVTLYLKEITNNAVNIQDGTVIENVYGGQTISNFTSYGSQGQKYVRSFIYPTNVSDNQVNISGGTVKGSVYGGQIKALPDQEKPAAWSSYEDFPASTAPVNNNTVTISAGTIGGGVYGGYNETAGDASGNTVNISGGTMSNTADIVCGGWAPGSGNAENNTVNIKGGTIKSNIYGGRTYIGNATGNTVNIYAVDNITMGIYGGSSTGGGSSVNNTLNILGTINITGYIYGYDTQTINIAAKDNHIRWINSGHNMNFFLPATTKAADVMLTIDDSSFFNTNLTGVTFGVAAQSGLSLNNGDKVTLIYDANGITTDDTLLTTTELTVPTGISTDANYKFSIEKEGTTAITATVTAGGTSNSEKLPERTKSLVETRAGMATLLNSGADLLAGQGMEQAAVAAESSKAVGTTVSGGSFAPFAAIGGGSLKAKSGSHVDTKSFGINLGLAKKIANRQGKLLLGPIFEYGHGRYDSYLDSGVHGKGNSTFYGGGIFAKQENHDGLYYEGSLRGGHMKADYKGILDTAAGLNAHYDTSSSYFAAHLGIGKVFALNKADSLDTYLKYFYSHTGSDDVIIHSNLNDERYHFDSVTSNRLRLGFRYQHALNDQSKLYGGLAWQYEFDGEAKASYNGQSTPAPSLKGSSGMLELGWKVKPSQNPLTLDLNVTGWAGKQQGVTAGLKANWEF